MAGFRSTRICGKRHKNNREEHRLQSVGLANAFTSAGLSKGSNVADGQALKTP